MGEEDTEGYEMTEEEKRLKAKDAEEEAELSRMMNDVTGTNRKIDDDYDDKMKKLDEKKKARPDSNEEIKSTIASLKERVSEIKNVISEARRAGKDPLIADLKMRNINAKIKMAELTGEIEDVARVEAILQDVEYELELAIEEEEIDVKKEIEEKLKAEIAKGKEKYNEEKSEA